LFIISFFFLFKLK